MFRIKTIEGDYSEVLLKDLEKRLNGLDGFKFSTEKQIEEIIKQNYKNVNDETLYKTACKITIFYSAEEFKDIKSKDEKIDLCDLTEVKYVYKNLFEYLSAKYS